MLAVWIQSQYFVLHAALGDNLAVGYAEFVNQCVGIDVVKAVTGRDLRSLMLEYGCKIGVFPVEVQKISCEVSLLEHVACAREIVDPGTCLLGPSLIAIEPLSERSERQTGSFSDQRLVGRLVNDETIDSVQQFLVGGGLEGCRRPRPRSSCSRQ